MDTKIKITNNNFIFSVDINTLGISSIVNKKTDDEYLKVRFNMPIFYLRGFYKGQFIRINPLLESFKEEFLRVKFEDVEVYANIKFSVKSDELLAVKIEIENNDKDFRVCETVGPNIYGLQLGNN